MAKINLVKTLGGLAGSTEQDRELLKAWRLGDVLRAEVRKPRNGQFHRKYFALLHLAFDNQERWERFDHFRTAVQIAAGHCETVIGFDGSVNYQPRSISFGSIDQMEFERLYGEVKQVLMNEIFTGISEAEVDMQLHIAMEF